MYFEPLISVKCCPKLHIKQLRTIYITFVCEIGLGVPPLDTPMLLLDLPQGEVKGLTDVTTIRFLHVDLLV